ncbi:MAG TPA: hypothetical protein VK604_14430 [Bryobacteraceae bacterium]|nr:hypothetical protein [Bryobacteraceae bacterium]
MLKNLTDALQTGLTTAPLVPSIALRPMAEDASALTPLNVIRTENVVSRFPVHNLSKKGKIEIQIVKRNSQGEIEIKWEVSYNDKHGQARQLAYKARHDCHQPPDRGRGPSAAEADPFGAVCVKSPSGSTWAATRM